MSTEITVQKTWHPHMLLKKQCEEERAKLGSPKETSSESEYILKGCCSGKRTRVLNDDEHGTAIGDCDRSGRFQIQSIAAVKGKFYVDISSLKLRVLEFVPNRTFTTIEFERLDVAWNCWELASPHLVESRGRLFLFVMTRNTLSSIALYKMDFSRLAWSSVDGLYDQVFFLGRLRFTASYSAWELGLKQGNVYYLGEDGLLNVFFPGDRCKPYSNYCHRSMDNLPAPLLSIHNALTKACGFTIRSS